MAAEVIGKAKCPLCDSPKATVSLSKKGLTCLTCMGCACQIFTRSGRSDEAVRALLLDAPKPERKAEPKVEPKVEPKAPPPPPATKPGNDWDPYA